MASHLIRLLRAHCANKDKDTLILSHTRARMHAHSLFLSDKGDLHGVSSTMSTKCFTNHL